MPKDSDISSENLPWRARLVLRRNRILSSKRFQRWASKMPLIGIIARQRAAQQFDLIAGFIYSQIIVAVIEADLLEYLADDLRSLEDIAGHCDLSHAATDRLLRAAKALQIVEEPVKNAWTLGMAGAPLSSNHGAIAMIRHHHLLYRDLADPLALLRDNRQAETHLSAFWTYAAKDKQEDNGKPRSAADYSELMAATQPMVCEQIIGSYDFTRHSRMLDIGGGSGAFAAAVSAVAPDLALGIFDLPDVMPSTQQRLAAMGLAQHVTTHPGSFKTDALPQGYDLITLIRILHDHDDVVVAPLLAKIHSALPSGGRLLIVEPMAQTRGAESMGDGYFGFYLWAMRSGRPRSAAENRQMLINAGFSSISEIKTAQPLITKAMVANK